jgi:DNA polymerase I
VKITFWLLDVNYEVKNHKPEIWLWGIDDKNRRVLIIDQKFTTYFYIMPEEGENPEKIMEKIWSQKKEYPNIIRMEALEKKYFGKPVKVVKVYCRDPDSLPKYAKSLQKIDGVKECLEDDIRYSMRYLIDNDVAPCGWHEIEVEKMEGEERKAQVDEVYLASSFPKRIEKEETPKLRVLGFSMICYSPKGTPKPEKNPVAIISLATNEGDVKQFVTKDSDDKATIESFVKYVQTFDPDIIVGYGTNQQDLPYLVARSRKHGINFSIDRAGTEPHTSVYGHMSITGRINIDFYDFSDELPEVKVKTLENIADYLGVMKLEEKTHIEEIELPTYWENSQKHSALLRFSSENTKCVMGIADAMLDFAIQLSNLVGLPLDHVGTAAVGFRVEWFLIREAYKINELVPKRIERPYIPYAGAIVLEPKPGIHENIAVLDFKAMYPNIMITYNVSPDTYVSPKDPVPKEGVHVAPEVNHKFRREPAGFYKKVISHLISVRDEIRLKLKELKPQTPAYRVLDARQRAVKIITNASYGYTGWIGARWYIKPVAEAATAWGRYTILNTIEMAKKNGIEVVYGDTDSVFVKHDAEKIEKFSKEISEKLGLEIKPEKTYVRILFTEAKKRYCGLLPNGQLDIVGLEVIRGDWAAVAKNVQEKILEIILREQMPQKAVEFVQQFITDLQEKKVPYKDLIIWKTLTKKVEEYAVKAAHVEAAKQLMKEGLELTIGDKVGYVIVVGSGKLYEKAKPYTLATYDDVDINYYVSNQVLPAATRILSMFGIKEEQLLPAKKPKTLSEFL